MSFRQTGFESWLRRWTTRSRAARTASTAPLPLESEGAAIAGTYAPLHTYLENRYANTVVLTFAEIEDLMGCALPQAAQVDSGWWGNDDSLTMGPQSRSWTLAHRTATPNLPARIVSFERREG